MSDILVKMHPSFKEMGGESGINTVIRKYEQHLPAYGIKIVGKKATTYDILAVHAGVRPVEPGGPVYAHLHGMYWTADYPAQRWQTGANGNIVQNLRFARGISVPTDWVAETIRRDMRFDPDIIPHGIDVENWHHDLEHEGFVLWAKNRVADVCDPGPTLILSRAFPSIQFVNTFLPDKPTNNMKEIGLVPHDDMRLLMQTAGCYLSLTKETFGIATLEALAAGTPVLGLAHGGNVDLVQHGVTGYLARPGDPDDLVRGLQYIMKYRKELSANAREAAKAWTWPAACEKIVAAYHRVLDGVHEPNSIAVVIPVYNKPVDMVGRAIRSALNQSRKPDQIIVVDDGSTDGANYAGLCAELGVQFHRQENASVAVARNTGARLAGNVKYLCFLDADDELAPEFLHATGAALDIDISIHVAYTRLMTRRNGAESVSQWPTPYDFNSQLRRKNQIPTANLMRADTFWRMGGYRARYCPTGAGSEDAELWTRMGAYGYRGKLVDERPLFLYTHGGGHTAKPGYSEVDWLGMHPWVRDGQHPFPSLAAPQNGLSHPVRQYDEPIISVIIPVGPGHGELLVNALDSLDAQGYRKWEAIVYEDGGDYIPDWVKKAFPHVIWMKGDKPEGPGVGRNRAAERARGDFLVFLDADDHLATTALFEMMDAWGRTEHIIYTDYRGIAYTDNPDELIQQVDADPYRQIIGYNDKTGQVIIHHDAGRTFDCEKAYRQPENPPYIWCLVTCLVPAVWHREIGGFDENMDSWEDVDYFWRMAWAGHCFSRVPKDLVIYRFGTGYRREAGRQIAGSLLKYLENKYNTLEKNEMGCGCGKKTSPDIFDTVTAFVSEGEQMSSFTFTTVDGKTITAGDPEVVEVVYSAGGAGQHKVIGSSTRIIYGRHKKGDQFLAHRNDAYIPNGRGGVAVSGIFVPIEQKTPKAAIAETAPPPGFVAPEPEPELAAPPPQPAAPILEDVPLTDISGVGPATEGKLQAAGINAPIDILMAGEPGLRAAGLSAANAQQVYTSTVKFLEPETA